MTEEITIRALSLGGTWETIGADRGVGIVPENVKYAWDTWGSSTASFILKRDPKAPWPDLTAWTPIEIWVHGIKVWSGRIVGTPTSDGLTTRQVAITAEGWQFHLDDDMYQRIFVHTRIGEWRDAFSFPTLAISGAWTTALTTAADSGVATLMLSKSTVMPSGTRGGIILDLGPNSTAASISVDWESSNNSAGLTLYARTTTGPSSNTGASDAFTVINNSAGSGTSRGTFATPARYIELFALNNTGLDLTALADTWFKLKGIRVFTNDTWRSTDGSILKASDIILTVQAAAAPLLSTDTSLIGASTFSIPEYAPTDNATPREHFKRANDYENRVLMVDVDQRTVYKDRPTAPVLELGAWSGAEYAEASTNDGKQIYNRAIVEGTGPDGASLYIERTTSLGSLTGLEAISTPAPDNPSFATNTTSWTNVIRDTGVYDTSPASGRTTNFAPTTQETFTGTFLKNTTYVLLVRFKDPNAGAYGPFQVDFGTTTDYATTYWLPTDTNFNTFAVAWNPRADATGVTFRFWPHSTEYLDSLQLYTATPTLVDRRGFRRAATLQTGSAMTAAGGNKIADTYLANHASAPLKGSIQIGGTGAIRKVLTGEPVHPATLGLYTNQQIRLTDRIDTDTGAVGKDATIVGGEYDVDTGTAALSLDNDGGNFDAFIARRGALVGQLA